MPLARKQRSIESEKLDHQHLHRQGRALLTTHDGDTKAGQQELPRIEWQWSMYLLR
jgi:hypothetical protein